MYFSRLIAVLAAELLRWAPQIEADMKRNASWTDRTSNARQGLSVFVIRIGNSVILVAKTQMSYGKYLELNNQGAYAIIMPTMRQYYRRVWSGVRKAVS